MALDDNDRGSRPHESAERGPPTSTGPDAPAADAQAPAAAGGNDRGPRFRAVAIGASAGGLEAIAEFLQAMRPGSGMAFMVVSHLDPEHRSDLSEILARAGALPVREAVDGMPVAPDHVYVMPHDRDMVLADGRLHLTPRAQTRGLHLPIDTFLISLAADCADRSAGVILSGTGTDGTLGLKAIKEAGGLTFAQDETARYDGMPRSAVAAGVVDAVLPPAQIAAELLRIARHPPAAAGVAPPAVGPAEDGALLRILRLLAESTGVDFVNYKHSTLLRRVERRRVLLRLPDLDEYFRHLQEHAAERQLLLEEVLIPVTGFFREPESFDVLTRIILPRLLPERPPRAPFRVWVPGCSTGEEAYSIAICILEYLGPAAGAASIKIFATDISERSIQSARAGAYGEGITAEVTPRRLHQFFIETDRGYQIATAVRDLCIFARQDLTRDPPFSQLDLISCRNVLIYLGPALQERVLPILHHALKPGGILMLGRSETVGGFRDLFEVVDRKSRSYARALASSRLLFDYPPGGRAKVAAVRDGGTDRSRAQSDVYRDVDRVVLARYAPSGVVVDEKFQVIQFRGDTGPYLKPPPGPPTAELLLMAREGLLGDLRETLDRASREDAAVRKEGVRVRTNDHYREVDLEAIPITDPATGSRHFVVLFEPTRQGAGAGAASPRPGASPAPGGAVEAEREIRRLAHDLDSTRVYLQSVIEQKEAANEELRAANEEVICGNEELQSTNDELTTAKEELQATNEELTTINDELQDRIRIANQLGDDLVNLIESTRIPIVVLGPDLCVRRFTPSTHGLMNLRPGDVGRPLGELKSKINVPDLERLVREVIDTLEIKQLEVVDEAGTWHKLYIRPYRTLDHKVGGAVVMLIDIDLLKRREEEARQARDYAVSIVETVREPLLVLDGDLRVRTANRAFYECFRVAPAEVEGRRIYELGAGQWDIPRLRSLLEELLPQNSHFEDFEVDHTFPGIGERTMLLNAHRVVQADGSSEPFILLAIEDITVRKRAERLRQETEDRLRTMVDTAVDAIITIDERGTISSINAATERMFGYAASELIGRNVSVLMPDPYHDQHDAYLARYLRAGERHVIGIGREVHGRRRDGTSFPADLAVSEYEDRGQHMFTGVLRDLTARHALEREVLEVATQEQQRIGQELHDTSAQELTALGLLSDGLVAALKEGSAAEAAIATKIAEGLRRVLGQIRSFARGLIRVDLEAQGLTAALAELAALTAEVHGVACTFESEGPVDVANGQTATQLYSIAREAVTNALKHAESRHITIRLEGGDRSLTLRVHDDGIGLPRPPIDTRGMGLKIMRYRAGLIDAHLSIEPADAGGTVLVCTCNKETRHGRDQGQAG